MLVDFLTQPPTMNEAENLQTAASTAVPEADTPPAASAAPSGNETIDSAAQIATLSSQIADLKDQVLRAHADVQNARRRAEEEISKARKFAVEAFAESMLPVVDSLEAGLAITDARAEQIREGAEATLRQLKSALERNKVLAIDPAVGSKFDPHQHQAISMVSAEQDANTVVSVLQKGYLIADRVLRPALITVSAPK